MKTQLTDFRFTRQGHGYYEVTYTSPTTGKEWTTRTNDMQLIDCTDGAEDPKQKDLDYLKKLCKR